jgi:hypothetical protein
MDGFTAIGGINLASAHIGGQLSLSGATLTNPNRLALQLQDLQAGTVILRDLREPPALVQFTLAQIGTLADDPASWPRQAAYEGFVYGASTNATLLARANGWAGCVAIPAATAPNPTSSWLRSTAAPAATRTPALSPSPSSALDGAP